MTDQQKARIRAAADELQAALTAVGDHFEIDLSRFDATTIQDLTRRYNYHIQVVATRQEVI